MAFFALSRLQPLTLLSVTDLASEYDRLLEENRHLRRAVTSHAVIDQAIGVVVVLGRIAPEEAWRALRDVSQRTNVKLRTVAEHVLGHVQGEDLPEPERIELVKAIVRYRRCGERSAPPGDGLPASAGPRPGPARTASDPERGTADPTR